MPFHELNHLWLVFASVYGCRHDDPCEPGQIDRRPVLSDVADLDGKTVDTNAFSHSLGDTAGVTFARRIKNKNRFHDTHLSRRSGQSPVWPPSRYLPVGRLQFFRPPVSRESHEPLVSILELASGLPERRPCSRPWPSRYRRLSEELLSDRIDHS